MVMNSATGRKPAIAAPTATPPIAISLMGVSRTRRSPNSSRKPRVTRCVPLPVSHFLAHDKDVFVAVHFFSQRPADCFPHGDISSCHEICFLYYVFCGRRTKSPGWLLCDCGRLTESPVQLLCDCGRRTTFARMVTLRLRASHEVAPTVCFANAGDSQSRPYSCFAIAGVARSRPYKR